MAAQPDLVLVMTDQQRHDHVGWFAGSPVRTPTLDRLASNGVILDHCYSASTTCVPARTALLSGVVDHRMATADHHAIRPGAFTLPRALRDVGYATANIGKAHFMPIRADHGFDHLEVSEHLDAYDGDPATWPELDHYHDWLVARGLPDWRYQVDRGARAPYPWPDETHPTTWVRDRTLELLANRDRDRPLFLVVSFPHPHPPVNPPERYFSMFDPDDVVLDLESHHRNDHLPSAFRLATDQADHPHRRVDPDRAHHHRRQLASTYGLIAQIDDAIADIVAALDLERTILWFTADHGDYGTNRGLVRKIPWIPFDDLARVPTFVTGGPVVGGRRFDQPCQSFDVATTFLDYAGWWDEHAEHHGSFDGISHRRVLDNGTAEPADDRPVWSAFSMNWPMVRRGPHKYIRSSGWPAEVLFDVVGDPHETIDLARHPFGIDLARELSALVDRQAARGLADLPVPSLS